MSATNLPQQLTSFVGREREIADVRSLMLSSHLVTLTGVGGSGKTRLAIEIANAVSERFEDGAWLVDLVPLNEPALVPQVVSLALGLRPPAEQSPLPALLSFVRDRQILLILDNCEHLSEACALLAHDLLAQASGLRILATSRKPLDTAGETIYSVSGLDWPGLDTGAGENPQELMRYDAVRLFVERARALSYRFDLNAANALPIVEICRRLDGLPLALELASARIGVLSIQEIADRLGDRLSLLVSNQRSGLDLRHRTLRATIDWSYALLAPAEQLLLRRLAVFEAGCTLDTAEAVCSGEDIGAGQILDLISSLVRQSLVAAETAGRTQARYRLLETIRDYAREKLEESGETARLRDRHLELFLARAEEAAPKLSDAYQQLWLNWLEGENDNLRAALAWSLESGRIESGLRLAAALVRFWEIRGYVREGMVWFERLLTQADERTSVIVHANALAYASFMAMFLGDAAGAMAYGQKAVDLAEAAGAEGNDVLRIALAGLATGVRAVGDFQKAFALEERAISLVRGLPGQEFYLGMALLAHGSVAIELGEYETARAALDESLDIAREAGDSFRIAHALNALGDLARCELRYAAARGDYERSAALLRELGAQRDLASVLHNLGHTWLHLGEVERGRVLFEESLAIQQALQNVPGMAECLIGFAAVALLRGLPAAGARLLGAADEIGEHRAATASVWRATRMEYEYYLDMAGADLGGDMLPAEMSIGRAMSPEQAVAYAQNLALKSGSEPAVEDAAGGLTAREREIAALVGQGKTNGEIAGELVLSKRTVETHISHILAKLELTSRGQIMRWAIDRGLS